MRVHNKKAKHLVQEKFKLHSNGILSL